MAALDPDRIPRHVGVILDGNRRWAAEQGDQHRAAGTARAPTRSPSSSAGATRSASRSSPCGCSPPTTSRARPASSTRCCGIIEDDRHRPRRRTAPGACTRWARSTCCPAHTAEVLKEAADATPRRAPGCMVNVAVGYGGRREVVDAVRALLADAAAQGHAASTTSPPSSTSSTSPSTSTPRASPTPTSSSARRASSGSPASCCGRARTRSSTSARPTGPTSARSTSCAPCARTARAAAASAPDRQRMDPAANPGSFRLAVVLIATPRRRLRRRRRRVARLRRGLRRQPDRKPRRRRGRAACRAATASRSRSPRWSASPSASSVAALDPPRDAPALLR